MTIRITRTEKAFVIRDTNGVALAYVYFEADPSRRMIISGLTEDEALAVAKTCARALRDNQAS